MLLTDRNFNTTFFDQQVEEILFYISIYFGFLDILKYYILILPAFGIISHVIAVYANRPIFGYLWYGICYGFYWCVRFYCLGASYVYCRDGCRH